jgi:hypothetical protein
VNGRMFGGRDEAAPGIVAARRPPGSAPVSANSIAAVPVGRRAIGRAEPSLARLTATGPASTDFGSIAAGRVARRPVGGEAGRPTTGPASAFTVRAPARGGERP